MPPVAGRRSAPPRVFLGFGYYLPELHAGVVRWARERRWELITNARGLRIPSGERYDGVILQNAGRPDMTRLAAAHTGRTVDITRAEPAATPHRVSMDAAAQGRMAADFLIRGGRRRLVFIGGTHWSDTEREEAFVSRAAETGARVAVWRPPAHLAKSGEVAQGASPLARWFCEKLGDHPGTLGVFVCHVCHARVFESAALEAGRDIPGEISLLGCDNDALLCDVARIPLSSLDPNFATIGYEAARLLDALMRGAAPAASDIRIPPAGIVERASTASLHTGPAALRKATQWIEETLDHDPAARPTVDDIARAAGVNRRALERLFAEWLGESPLRHVIRRRMDAAEAAMIADPTLTGERMAEQFGFSAASRFYAAYLAAKGHTFGVARRRHAASAGADWRRP